jgi:ribosome biogenesis GTPase / thiamine phosphate phosphatase
MTELATGRVVRCDAKSYLVTIGGETRAFVPRGKLFDTKDADVKSPVVVGDLVRVSLDGDPPGVEEVLPRKNYLPRVASSHDPRQQILFANVDQLFIVASLAKPTFSSNRADRILAACRYHEIPAQLVLNKIDLDKDDLMREITRTYVEAGVEVLPVCATERRGLETLAARLTAKTSVLYGGSGAGKSTILNALEPGLTLKTGKISKFWDQGKHTTTHSQVHALPSLDAWVIDTPGIRVFRLTGINKAELRDCYPEFAPFAAHCRYGASCSHDHEPGCAVFEAVEKGQLAPTRFASYVEILDELVPPPPDDTPEPPPER